MLFATNECRQEKFVPWILKMLGSNSKHFHLLSLFSDRTNHYTKALDSHAVIHSLLYIFCVLKTLRSFLKHMKFTRYLVETVGKI